MRQIRKLESAEDNEVRRNLWRVRVVVMGGTRTVADRVNGAQAGAGMQWRGERAMPWRSCEQFVARSPG